MWTRDSWKSKPIAQSIPYPSKDALNCVVETLSTLPPLVSVDQVQRLRNQLKQVAEGKRFLLQGGDCAELFSYCSEVGFPHDSPSKEPIQAKLKVLLQMSLILTWGGQMSVVRIGRMGGQYAKPRSAATETVDGAQVVTFRGDSVNGLDLKDRTPDPQRLLSAYFHSAATINYVNHLLNSDFADLHHPDAWTLKDWDLNHVVNPNLRSEYQSILEQLGKAIDFMRTIGADDSASIKTVDMFMSHEGLLLDYETALTRYCSTDDKYYNLGAHFLWIGDRTRQLNGAHVEYFRGLANPIGVKVGPSMDPEELVRLLDILDADFETGKITLITRYGHDKIEQYLGGHIRAVQETKHKVVWCCDPMHGNTETTETGLKTRRFENIAKELKLAFEIHLSLHSRLNGVHFELTGDRVTECVGGSMKLQVSDLSKNYQTHCDPRLNYEQSLDIAFLIAKMTLPL